jgi:hypothetical protein
MLDRRRSKSCKPSFQRWIQQVRNQFLPSTTCIATVGHAAQPNEITSEWRWGSRDHRETFTKPRRRVDRRERDSSGSMIPPCPTGLVQEFLQCDWLFIPDVIDPSNARPKDRRFNGNEIRMIRPTCAWRAAAKRLENQHVLVSGRKRSGRGANSRPAKWTITSAPEAAADNVIGSPRSALIGRTCATCATSSGNGLRWYISRSSCPVGIR